VAGRCRDIAVDPDNPRRLYVASALGGLWYSDNHGETWLQVGAFTTLTDRALIPPSTTSLSCGAVYVIWGDDETEDEVWLGSGEPSPLHQPHDRGYKGYYAGLGILYARGPVAAVRTDPNTDPWTRQAGDLVGASVFSFVADPSDPRRIVAATTRGLRVHDPLGSEDADPWSLVTVAAWDNAPSSPGSAKIVVTDVSWVGGTRLWAAVRQTGTPLTGLWRSDNGAAGPFVDVPVDAREDDGEPKVDRIALAATPLARDVLYVLATGPRASAATRRVDGPEDVRFVGNYPTEFFGDPNDMLPGDHDQSAYDMAIAVDPDDGDRFMIGGASAVSRDGTRDAALYRLSIVDEVTPDPGQPWTSDYGGLLGRDLTWVGRGVHADVHRVRWVSNGIDVDVYVCTDGGVYHSARGGDNGTYVSRNTGMSVTEEIFSSSHPTSDGVVLSGVQDNGAQLRIGDGVWSTALSRNGDGGGVAFDPTAPHQLIAQSYRSNWTNQNDEHVSPTERSETVVDAYTKEERASSFYSNPAVIDNGFPQLVVGTSRVWYTEQWGASIKSADRDVIYRQWFTLPSLTDPRDNNHADIRTDVIPPGPLPPGTTDRKGTGIRVLRWGTVDRLYVLMPGALYRFDRNEAGKWNRTRIEKRPTLPVGGTPPPAAAGRRLPPNGSMNDLAVHDVDAGPHGSFYVATSHPEEPLWWFDGTNRFHPCGLGADGGMTAPGYAVVVDPDDASTVYVGTALGVFQGVLSLGSSPAWTWRGLTNGLPEAAVQDLTIMSWPRPEPQTGSIKLMRAGLQSRGMWELELTPGGLVELTFLRTHPYDTRRILPSPMLDPLFDPEHADRDWPMDIARFPNRDTRDTVATHGPHPDGTPREVFLWHESPDIRVRPAPGSAPLAIALATASVPFPWKGTSPGVVLPNDRYLVWALQTALHALDPMIVPNGSWTPDFNRRLEQLRGNRDLDPPGSIVDDKLWNHADVQAAFWSEPFVPGGPTEADLIERLVGMRTPRTGLITESGASVGALPQPSIVDVCVHRRGLAPAAAGEVAVLLLLRPLTEDPLTEDPHTWASIAAPALTGLDALDGVAPSGGPVPSSVGIPTGWEAVAVGRPLRDPRTSESAVVSIPVDLSGRTGIWLLLALVRHGPDTPQLLSGSLPDLVRGSPHVAARTIHLVPPPSAPPP
jgi:hypothetical protein